MEKNFIVSLTNENERISIKNSLPSIKCVLRLSCVVHGPIYGRFLYQKGKTFIAGFHMTSLKFKVQNYRSYQHFTLTIY